MSCRAFFLAVTGLGLWCAAYTLYIEVAAFGSCSWQPEWCFELAVECCGAHDLRKSQPQSMSCENVSAFEASRETVETTVPFDLEYVSEAQRRSLEGRALGVDSTSFASRL